MKLGINITGSMLRIVLEISVRRWLQKSDPVFPSVCLSLSEQLLYLSEPTTMFDTVCHKHLYYLIFQIGNTRFAGNRIFGQFVSKFIDWQIQDCPFINWKS